MNDLTWTSVPTSTPAVTLEMGQFAAPASSVTLQETSLAYPYTMFLQAFSPAGAPVGFCMEYAGLGYTYQGPQLVSSSCADQVSPQTYQFTLTGDIGSVLAGTYMAAGPPNQIEFAALPTYKAREPTALALFAIAALVLLLRKKPAQ